MMHDTGAEMAKGRQPKPGGRSDADLVDCQHCGRIVAFRLRGELTIKCRRCKKTLMIFVGEDGVQKNLLTTTPPIASR